MKSFVTMSNFLGFVAVPITINFSLGTVKRPGWGLKPFRCQSGALIAAEARTPTSCITWRCALLA